MKLKLTQQEQTDIIIQLIKNEKKKEVILWIIIFLIYSILLGALFFIEL